MPGINAVRRESPALSQWDRAGARVGQSETRSDRP